MDKIIEKLNLEDDFLFAKVMSDQEICRKVLEKILNIKIREISMPSQQKVIDILLDSKAIRLDIYVNDECNTVYNIEMQKGKQKNLSKRSRYYQGNIDLDMITKGADYNELNRSFVIFICTFDPFDKGRHMYTFNNICNEDKTLVLGDETTKVFLNTKGTINDVDNEMAEFLAYIENSTDEFASHAKSALVKEIHKKVINVKQDKRVEVEYMTLLERDREKIQEGIEKGIEKGIERVARKMIVKGKSNEEIMEVTDLTIEQIEKLRSN